VAWRCLCAPLGEHFLWKQEDFYLLFNKNRLKTWWIREIVVTLHPLFVAPMPEALSLT
jgi:hypothetical protein